MKILAYILISLLAIVLAVLRPIDRDPIEDEPFYTEMMQRMAGFELADMANDDTNPLQVGWASVNITPDEPELLIGYKPRGPYVEVHDSIFVRSLLIDNGAIKVAIVSMDLLLVPPALVQYLEQQLSTINFDINNIYFTATHTHTSIGAWLNSFAGQFIAGNFDPKRIEWLGDKIIESIEQARATKSAGAIGFQKIETQGLVEHRLDKPSKDIDESLRIIRVNKENGERGIWVTFSAHPSLISKNTHVLSGDYPAAMLQDLKEGGFDFAMFSAGMVGSHRPKEYGLFDIEFLEDYGSKLANIIIDNLDSASFDSTAGIAIQKLSLSLPKSQMRLTKEIGVRDWIFTLAMGELDAEIKILQIGDILMLGMPSDFSGELSVNGQFDKLAIDNDRHLMITSFNGDYIGYITDDSNYDTSVKDEVRSLNWVGPYMGAYFTKVVTEIID
ncbi:neutral/alkaline non-lysosomal ceramidase N-terminal domain-containing protein [Fulvivirgaceae bacterium LMO-SS25]